MKFQDTDGYTTNINLPPPDGVDRAKSISEIKLTEDAVVEGLCGSLTDLDRKIELLEKKINNLKAKLIAFKNPTLALQSAYCVGYHTCNIAGLLSNYSSAHIAVIEAEIEALDINLEALEYTRTLYAFMKPNNMRYN